MLSDADLERYARQVIMPDMGEAGQEALLAARVLIVGAGGLGAPVLLYLASAGIGSITIIDDDIVSRSDLNRQIIYQTEDISSQKVKQAAAAATKRSHGEAQRARVVRRRVVRGPILGGGGL